MLKLNIFQIFITILFLFILTIIIYENFVKPGKNYENFENRTLSDSMYLYEYSSDNKVTPLNETIYFDEKNGNIIFTNGIGYGSKMVVVGRDGKYSEFNVSVTDQNNKPLYGSGSSKSGSGSGFGSGSGSGAVVSSANIPVNMTSSYASWIFPVANQKLTLQFDGQIIYIPSGKETYLQIIDGQGRFNPSFYFNITGARNVFQNDTCNNSLTSKLLRDGNNFLPNENDNSYIVDDFYDEASTGFVYQITNGVEFDVNNGKLITYFPSAANGTNKNIVYNRMDGVSAGNNTTYTIPQQVLDAGSNIPANVTLNSWSTVDTIGNNMIVYMGIAQNTVISVLHPDPKDSKNKLFTLVNVKRFDGNGNVVDSDEVANTPVHNVNNFRCQNQNDKGGDDDYYKWYWYWILNGGYNTNMQDGSTAAAGALAAGGVPNSGGLPALGQFSPLGKKSVIESMVGSSGSSATVPNMAALNGIANGVNDGYKVNKRFETTNSINIYGNFPPGMPGAPGGAPNMPGMPGAPGGAPNMPGMPGAPGGTPNMQGAPNMPGMPGAPKMPGANPAPAQSVASRNFGGPMKGNDYILKTEIVPPVCPAYPAFLVDIPSTCNINTNIEVSKDEKQNCPNPPPPPPPEPSPPPAQEQSFEPAFEPAFEPSPEPEEKSAPEPSPAPAHEPTPAPAPTNGGSSSGNGSGCKYDNYNKPNNSILRPFAPGSSNYLPLTDDFSAFRR